MPATLPGKSLSNTQTKNSSTVVDQSSSSGGTDARDRGRGERLNPPKGPAQLPGKGLSNSQTRNSRDCEA